MLSQSSSVVTVGSSLQVMMSTIENLNSHIADQTKTVCVSSSSVNRMLANIQVVVGTVEKNLNMFEDLSNDTGCGKKLVTETLELAVSVDESLEVLLKTSKIIQKIAA